MTPCGVAVDEGLAVGVAVGVAVDEGRAVGVAVAVSVTTGVSVAVAVAVAPGVPDAVEVADASGRWGSRPRRWSRQPGPERRPEVRRR